MRARTLLFAGAEGRTTGRFRRRPAQITLALALMGGALVSAGAESGGAAAVEWGPAEGFGYRGWVTVTETYGSTNSEHFSEVVLVDSSVSSTTADLLASVYSNSSRQCESGGTLASEQAGIAEDTALLLVRHDVNREGWDHGLPVPTEMLTFEGQFEGVTVTLTAEDRACGDPYPNTYVERPITMPAGFPWAVASYEDPPNLVNRTYTFSDGLYDYAVAICMSRSEVDTDEDGLPDQVDMAPTTAASPTEFGLPGFSATELPGPEGGPVGRAFRPACEGADTTPPRATIVTPGASATYARDQVVAADYSCSDDAAGSGIDTCDGTVEDGAALDTSTLGQHDVTVTATDNAGNTASVTHPYTVADARPDSRVKRGATGALRGNNIYNTLAGQTASGSTPPGQSVTYYVSVQNDAPFADRLRLAGRPSTVHFTVRYFDPAGANITNQVTAGTHRTPTLGPQATYQVKVTVTASRSAPNGASVARTLTAASTTHPGMKDTVQLVTTRS